MIRIARRVGIAVGSLVIAWLAVSLVAGWLFGSGNILVWVIALVVGAGVYPDILRRDRRTGWRRFDAMEALLSAIKLGAHCWNQYADWPSLLATGQRVERLGYDALWAWDH